MPKRSQKKQEYSKILNEIFGTNIKWEKLSLAELTELATVLAHKPEQVCSKLCGETSIIVILKKLLDAIPEELEGPLLRLLKKALSK